MSTTAIEASNPNTPDGIFEAALLLKPEDRAELAMKLIASLETVPEQQPGRTGLPELSEETKATIHRRLKEIDDGTVTLLDGEEVFQRLRTRKSRAAL